jgi:hypothetical protein
MERRDLTKALNKRISHIETLTHAKNKEYRRIRFIIKKGGDINEIQLNNKENAKACLHNYSSYFNMTFDTTVNESLKVLRDKFGSGINNIISLKPTYLYINDVYTEITE